MSTIFVVLGVGYEHTSLIRAFVSRERAEALRAACQDYAATHPHVREIEDTPENEAAFERKLRRWQKKHPAGECHAYEDEFVVSTLELEQP